MGFAALLPLLVLTATVLALLVSASFRRGVALPTAIAVGGMICAVATLPMADRAPDSAIGLLTVDRFAVVYQGVLILAGAACAVLGALYLERHPEHAHEELLLLMVLATLGGCVLAAASSFATIFLGLETMSVSLYGLVAYRFERRKSLDAAMKYLVLGSVASAFLLFGMALAYADTGTMDLVAIAHANREQGSGLLAPGLGMILIGLGFKLALVPLHVWIPDVYEGAPAPITALLTTVSKGSVMVVLLRLFPPTADRGEMQAVLAAAAVLSMVVGSLLALQQVNVKRLLAYSSIAHVGNMLVGIAAGGGDGGRAVNVYLVTYIAASLCGFGSIAMLSGREREAERLDDLDGLWARQPLVSLVLTITMLSLAGMPLTGGFLAKFSILTVGVDRGMWVAVFALVLTSLFGFGYYLRVLYAIFKDSDGTARERASVTWGGGAILGALALFLLVWGVDPAPLIESIAATAPRGP